MNITSDQAVRFVNNIFHRFGVPNSIIMDNSTQFIGNAFLQFCDEYHIRVGWAAVARIHVNGQVKRANDMIPTRPQPWVFSHLKQFDRQ